MYYFSRICLHPKSCPPFEFMIVSQLYQKIGNVTFVTWFDSQGKPTTNITQKSIIDLPINFIGAKPYSHYYSDMVCRRQAILEIVSKGTITTSKVWEF